MSLNDLALTWAKSITRIVRNGHKLEDVKNYPVALIRAIDELISEVEADDFYLNAVSSQGSTEAVQNELKKFNKKA